MWLTTNSGPFELLELRIEEPKLKGLRVLHISDLHFAPGQRQKKAFIEELAELKPDLVVNTGDNLGHKQAISAALAALAPLGSFPGVFVNGSNDYRSPSFRNPLKYLAGPSKVTSERNLDTDRFVTELENFGWLNLNNQEGELELAGVKLGFLGLDDPHENLDDLASLPKQKSRLTHFDYLIGVAHAPYHRVIDAFSAQGANFMFSGHTHGGQICLPGKKAIITNCDLEKEFASGLSAWGNGMILHVSSGAGHSTHAPVRLFCPPSATLISFS